MEQHVDLDIIGVIEGSDRSSSVRPALDQWRHYESLLAPLRRSKINLIDLSPGDGAALTVWRWFLSAATIVAVDAGDGRHAGQVVHRTAVRGDRAALAAICAEFPPSILVDGGPFTAGEPYGVFEHLLPRLAPGGLYLLPGLGVPGTGAEGLRPFLDLARACTAARPAAKAHPDEPGRLVDSVIFLGGGVAIRRRSEGRDLTHALNTADAYLTAQRRDSGALERLATYIMRHGGPLARAEAAVDAAIEDEGATLPRILLRAEILVAQKRTDEASEAVAAVAGWADKKPAHLHRLARLYAGIGNHAAALAEAEAALAAEPGNAAFRKTVDAMAARAGR